MKKMLISMLAMAAMVSCSSESDPIDEVNPTGDNKVEIKLNTGVGEIITKATAKTDLKNSDITILKQNGNALPSEWASYSSNNYLVNALGGIELNTEQKYYDNSEAALNSYFLGIYPKITPAPTSGDVVKFTNYLGEDDILCSKVYDAGNKGSQTNATTEHMEFDHMLSKITIKLEATPEASTAFGEITKIAILKMPKSLDLSLKNRVITANDTPDNAELTIYQDVTGKTIADMKQADLPDKFVIPGLAKESATDFQIVIITKNYNGTSKPITISGISTTVDATPQAGTLAGYNHIITLKFKDNISITTSVNSMNTGGSGSGNVEN